MKRHSFLLLPEQITVAHLNLLSKKAQNKSMEGT